MTDAIDAAAAAFSRDMGDASSAPSAGIRDRANAPEPIFGNSDHHEGDQAAGGDDTPSEDERKTRRQRETEPQEEPEDNEWDYDPENDDEDQDKDEDAEEDEDEDDLLAKEFTLMVDGEEETVTLKEALDGYNRTKTFHKRMNQLDGVRKELIGHAQKVAEDRQRSDAMLADAEEIMAALIPQEPDWDKLYAEDPAAARNLQKQYDGYKARVEEIRQKRIIAQQSEAERAAREEAEFVKNEFPRFAEKAKWRDKEDMNKDLRSMRKTALSEGFTEEEVGKVYDSRMLNLLLKASKYDRMMAAKPRPVKTGKTPVSPGAGSKSTARRGVIGAQKQLARTGSIDDAADVFSNILKNQR